MTATTIKQLPKSSVELDITLPWDEIKAEYQKVFDEVAAEMELPGFRKGKAPKKMIEENINRPKIYEEVLKRVVPKAYSDAVKENKLQPVSSPKVEVLEAKELSPWKLKVTIAQKPKINLKNYKTKVSDLNKSKKTKIWLPGETKKEEPKETKAAIAELMDTLASEVEVEISDILVEDEVNKLLSGLIDQTVEQYIQARNTTSEKLREDYTKEALKNLTIEFALAEIADKENITVAPEDIDKLLEKVENSEEKDKLRTQSYYLAHLIRQQKTLDFLASL